MRPVLPFRAALTPLAAVAFAAAYSFAPLAASAAEPGNPLGLKADLALFSALVFLLLLAFLTYFAWKPVMDGLEKREHGIASDIENARRDRESAEQRLKEYEARLAKAEAEISTLHADAKRDVERMRERIVEEAKVSAEAERRRAVADIENAKRVALDDLTQRSVDMAMAIASRIARKEIGADQHAALIREALDRFPADRGASSN